MKPLLKWLLRALVTSACGKPKICIPVTVRFTFGILIGALLGISVRIIYESDSNQIYADFDDNSEVQIVRKNSTILFSAIQLRCVVFLDKKQEKKIKYMSALKDTYMQRCNQTVVFTNSKDIHKKFLEDTYVIYMETWKSEYYWDLYRMILKQLSKSEVDLKDHLVDWTIIGNEQLYVVVENLKEYLDGIDPEAPIILGSVMKKRNILSFVFPFGSNTILSIQAGIILSRRALRDLQTNQCSGIFFPSSTESAIYECASKIGINIMEPRDQDGMQLLHSVNVKRLIGTRSAPSTGRSGSEQTCCSDRAISFGSLNYKELRLLDYTINKVKVFGVNMVL